MRYEQRIIRPLLRVIEKYQEFLTQPENLPQLAKLGFMFEKFFYAGRVAYGYEGTIKKGYVCENNPKYELGDRIKYLDEKIEDLVYDAWGMHVSNDPNKMTFEEIKNLILNGKELSEFEREYRKPDKTFDEWVKVLTDERFQYHSIYPDRQSVADHLLCVIGNGYGYNKETGMVFNEAGGADQDQDIYGEWENAVFDPRIQKIVDRILAVPELKLAFDAEAEAVKKWEIERKARERKDHKTFYELILKAVNENLKKQNKPEISFDDPKLDEIVEKYIDLSTKEDIKKRRKSSPRKEYYPICNYSIITMFDEKTHPSYIKAGIEICEDILAYPPQEKDGDNEYQKQTKKEMIEFAENFLKKFKK